jgi:hypothetical protein
VKGWCWKVRHEQVAAIEEMEAAQTPVADITRLPRPTIYRVLGQVTQVAG